VSFDHAWSFHAREAAARAELVRPVAARQQVSAAWTGWVGFTAVMLCLIGAVNFFEGLIGIVRDEYYVVSGRQVILFDLTTWGWIMLFWGIVLLLAGVGLAAGRVWARWFAVVAVSLNLLGQLGFLGNTQYPLWSLVVIAIEIAIIYALTARWSEVKIAE
jgi:hypothetical protein